VSEFLNYFSPETVSRFRRGHSSFPSGFVSTFDSNRANGEWAFVGQKTFLVLDTTIRACSNNAADSS